MILALLLASFIKIAERRAASFMKTTVYVPAVVSTRDRRGALRRSCTRTTAFANWFLELFGLAPVAWLNDPAVALPAIAVPGIWLGFGITTLIMLAGLLDIPESYYESASLDGAGLLGQRPGTSPFRSLKNVLLYLLVTGFILSMQDVRLLPLLMTNGGPVGATTTPNCYIFNNFRDRHAVRDELLAHRLAAAVRRARHDVRSLMFRLINSDKAVDG